MHRYHTQSQHRVAAAYDHKGTENRQHQGAKRYSKGQPVRKGTIRNKPKTFVKR